jgi:O-antigen/teichoic acid export membrane protein
MAVKLVSYTDQTVIGLTLGAASVALFALPLQLIEYGRVLINGIGAVLLPRLTVLEMKRDIRGLGNAYVEVSRMTCAVAAFINVQLIMLGPAFLARWVGHEFAAPAPVILLCLGIASVLQAVSIQAPLPFLQATRHLTLPAIVLLAEGVVNVALSLALIPRFGLNGVALGTLIPSFFISFLVIPFFVCRRLDVRPARLVSHAILPAFLVGGITLFVLAGLDALYASATYRAIVAKAVVSAIPAAALLALVVARSGRSALLGITDMARHPVGQAALSIEE